MSGVKDPWPYDGPIARADGKRPFNHHLWPDDDWWLANRDLGDRLDSRWNFHVIPLADGRWSIEMYVVDIERDRDDDGRRVVYADRVSAIRASAARLIRRARASRDWTDPTTGNLLKQYGALDGAALAMVINWARAVVARETDRPQPKPLQPPAPRQPDQKAPPSYSDLPLFRETAPS